MNAAPNPRPPLLLPHGEEADGLGFFRSESFPLCLVDFPGAGIRLNAFAEHRPTVPEFLGAGWHLPLDRILANFQRHPGKATLVRGTGSHALRQRGWNGADEVEYEGTGLLRARFRPRDNQWIVESPDGLETTFAASPGTAPRAWFPVTIRRGEDTRFRFAYHHSRCTHLLEMRDADGYCARFEHAPLRGDHSKLLLRAISLEGPKRTTLGRLQFSYAIDQATPGGEAFLQSILVRESGSPPRSFRGTFDYFPARRNRQRLLKALHLNPGASWFFVPGSRADSGLPHPDCHPPAVGLAHRRVWHEESLTVVVEQIEERGASATTVSLYSRGLAGFSRRRLRHCQADLEGAICRASGDQVLLAFPNRLHPGRFEVILWRPNAVRRDWVSHRRFLMADEVELAEPFTVSEAVLRVIRKADPHTCYQFQWFDLPRAWSLTCLMPAMRSPAATGRSARIASPEAEQDALFARRTFPGNDGEPPLITRTEDQIDWQPDELFSGLGGHQDLALIS